MSLDCERKLDRAGKTYADTGRTRKVPGVIEPRPIWLSGNRNCCKHQLIPLLDHLYVSLMSIWITRTLYLYFTIFSRKGKKIWEAQPWIISYALICCYGSLNAVHVITILSDYEGKRNEETRLFSMKHYQEVEKKAAAAKSGWCTMAQVDRNL